MIGHALIVDTMDVVSVNPYGALELCDGNATYEYEESVEGGGTSHSQHSIYFTANEAHGGGEYCLHTQDWAELRALVNRLPWQPRNWPT